MWCIYFAQSCVCIYTDVNLSVHSLLHVMFVGTKFSDLEKNHYIALNLVPANNSHLYNSASYPVQILSNRSRQYLFSCLHLPSLCFVCLIVLCCQLHFRDTFLCGHAEDYKS